MAQYIFYNPKTHEVKEVTQRMSEPHVYEVDGVKWERVWTKPTMSTDVEINPFSEKEFVSKTSTKNYTVGDMWDKSKEVSEKREKKHGVDPVKKKYFENWSKKRKGKKHFLDN